MWVDWKVYILVGGIIRNERAIIVTGNTEIIPNDKVVIFALPSGIQKIEKMFS